MNATVSASCTDNAGNTTKASVSFGYDDTPPTVTGGTPSRPPDHNGWYNHPVSFTFTGTDDMSGTSCSSVTYSGPDSGTASVTGSCTDGAGNTATRSVSFRYSAVPPALGVAVSSADQRVTLRSLTSQGVSSFSISRAPGLKGHRRTVVYRSAGVFTDTHVRNGVRYRYTITATDQAGVATVRTVYATPGRRLLTPPPGSQLSAPPRLSWTSVLGASYYNVQLYRGGRKILSSWPGAASLRLHRRWSFNHSHWRLRPGTYRWYVWPGFGNRSAARYGRLVGSRTFRVVAPG